MSIEPYYTDAGVMVYLGDCRTVVPLLDPVDLVIADPPYQSTANAWDHWPEGWPTVMATKARAMWCFGTLRSKIERAAEFGAWTFGDEVVWDKGVNTSQRNDRFAKTHELISMWYRGPWSTIYHVPPREGEARQSKVVRKTKPDHFHAPGSYTAVDDGTRIVHSVMRFANMHGRGRHPSEKPVGLLHRLIEYGCPPGGIVLDPFGGSGATATAALMSGRRVILVEGSERYCETIVNRLRQPMIPTH